MAQFEITTEKQLLDEPVQIKLFGLEPTEIVTIQAEFCDDFGQMWASWVACKANLQGEVDLATTKPIDGTYQNLDGMGLFWSMKLCPAESGQSVPFVNTVTKSLKPLSIELRAKRQEETIATAVIERKFLTEEVRRIDVREEGLVATLFVSSTLAQGPVVIVLGGSGGGLGWSHQVAALLAAHGCTAIAIAYFDWQGNDNLPNQLVEIPVECIGKAITHLLLLRNDLSTLAIIGYSKGAELALLAAATYCEINRVVAYVPSSVIWHGFQMQGSVQKSSWSYQGQAVPFLSFVDGYFDEAGWQAQEQVDRASIPIEKISGSILLISATNDGVWPSTKMAEMIFQRAKAKNQQQKCKHLRLDGAGHNLSVPFLPVTVFANAESAVHAHSEYLAWQEVLRFLKVKQDTTQARLKNYDSTRN